MAHQRADGDTAFAAGWGAQFPGMQKGIDRLAAANVKNVSLTNFDVIAEVAAEEGYIRPEDVQKLIAFRNNPSDESWIHTEAK